MSGSVTIPGPTRISRIPAVMHSASFLALDDIAQRATPPRRALVRLLYPDAAHRLALKNELGALAKRELVKVDDTIDTIIARATVAITLREAAALPHEVRKSAGYMVFNTYPDDIAHESSFANVEDANDWLWTAAFAPQPLGYDTRLHCKDFDCPALLIAGPAEQRFAQAAPASSINLHAPIENHVHLPPAQITTTFGETASEEIVERDHNGDIVRVTKHPLHNEKRP